MCEGQSLITPSLEWRPSVSQSTRISNIVFPSAIGRGGWNRWELGRGLTRGPYQYLVLKFLDDFEFVYVHPV